MSSIQELINEHRIRLGQSIKNRHKIYLDTKYWGLLCDVSLGIDTNSTSKEIYNTLLQLSKDKKIICPLSYRIYSELRKQKDIKRLHETAKIMDILSEGVTIISENERIDYELAYFFYKQLQGEDSINEPNIFVWTKIAFIVGTTFPDNSNILSEEENEYIQKGIFNELWNLSLFDMIQKLGFETNSYLLNSPLSTANTINCDKVKFEYQLKSSENTYMDEIAGSLDVYKDRIQKEFIKYAINSHNLDETFGTNPENDIQPIVNMFYNLFKKNKMGLYLPTIDVNARAHATIRWNKTRQYKANDFDDIGHMYTALPYYEYFFTEKSFYTIITQENYDKKYSCEVFYKDNDVLKAIKNIF